MKRTIQIFLLLLSLSAFSQQDTQPIDFMVLTSEIDQFEQILLTAKELGSYGDFKIVLYGKNVTELLSPATEVLIIKAKKWNVKLSVCQMSLDMLKINHKAVPKQVEIVDNAFLYALQLKKAGYKTLNI